MNEFMSGRDAADLCKLRIEEDGIDAALALREFRQLTGWGLRDAESIYRQFQKLEKGQPCPHPHHTARGGRAGAI